MIAMTQTLHVLLASTYALYTKTQNFHWNVEGSDFFELHELFEKMYSGFASEIDTIAELIRTLGDKVPSGLDVFKTNSRIKDSDHNLSSHEMVQTLIADYEVLLALFTEALDAIPNNQIGVRHQLAGMYANHQKTLWMLSTWSKNK